jgi:hypothetical protein
MRPFCKTYSTEVLARQAVEALRAAGVPGQDIRLLTGRRLHDARREPAGGFAGTVGPNAPVGTFASGVRLRRQGAGAFAGDPDRQRQGSFADADHCVIVTFEDQAERMEVTGGLEIRRHLRRCAHLGEAAERLAGELRMGRAAVLVDVAEIEPSDPKLRLEELEQAA